MGYDGYMFNAAGVVEVAVAVAVGSDTELVDTNYYN